MADNTKIEWADATWQVTTGCSVVSPGCTNCYAMRLAGTRMQHHPSRAGLTQPSKAGPVWTGEVRFNEQWLDQPLRWKKPRRIFVAAHGDLFHENLPDAAIDRVFAVMALCPQHTFIVLTKRAARMREYFADPHTNDRIGSAKISDEADRSGVKHQHPGWGVDRGREGPFRPLDHVWLGVSVEDQAHADERIPELLATPAAVRFVSAEPLLGPLHYLTDRGDSDANWVPRLDWTICGGESGPGARPMHPDWARALRDQCQAAGVPFFFKQWGEWIGADEWLDQLGPGDVGIYDHGADFLRPWRPARPLNFGDAATLVNATCKRPFEHHSDGTTSIRVGKRAAGRRLDGREWSEYPR